MTSLFLSLALLYDTNLCVDHRLSTKNPITTDAAVPTTPKRKPRDCDETVNSPRTKLIRTTHSPPLIQRHCLENSGMNPQPVVVDEGDDLGGDVAMPSYEPTPGDSSPQPPKLHHGTLLRPIDKCQSRHLSQLRARL